MGSKTKGISNLEAMMTGFLQYLASVLISCAPIIAFDFYITKEQKAASRVANMQAINELNDVEKFAGYGTKEQNRSERIDSGKFLL